jgi:hypothetical protein
MLVFAEETGVLEVPLYKADSSPSPRHCIAALRSALLAHVPYE